MLERTLAHRRARTLAGQVGVAWFVLMFLIVEARTLQDYAELTHLLLLWIPIVTVVYGLRRLVARLAFAPEPLTLSLVTQAQAWEGPSLVWPAMAGALFLPLTIHAALWAMFGDGPLVEFDDWIWASAVLTFPAHVALAAYATSHASRLARARLDKREVRPAEMGAAVGVVTLAGLVPGVVLLGIPTALVFFTSLVVVPMIYVSTRRDFNTHREALIEALRAADRTEPGELVPRAQAVLQDRDSSGLTLRTAISVYAILGDNEPFTRDLDRFLEARTSGTEPLLASDTAALRDALQLFMERGRTPSMQPCMRLALHSDPEVAKRAIRFLSHSAEPRVQMVLRKLLVDRVDSIRLAAVRALNLIGTLDVVEDLGALATRTTNGRLRVEARTAVKGILQRVGGVAAPASLSFPSEETTEGALSHATAGEAGALSDVDPWRSAALASGGRGRSPS